MKKKVLVKGPALSCSGYGEHTRLILRALKQNEDYFEIFLDNLNWGKTGCLIDSNEESDWMKSLLPKTHYYKQNNGSFDIAVQVTIPNEWTKIAPVNIGVTAGIETTKIAPHWVEKTQLVDKIIVPSEHARYAFDHTSYEMVNNKTGQKQQFKNQTPIEVVHYPVKDTEPADVDLNLDYDFNFLVVAQWGPRKNLDSTIRWFVEEFKDEEVGLIIKANTAKNNILDRRFSKGRLDALLQNYPDRRCKIYLVHGNMSEEEICGIYTNKKVKAIVSATHGEGFGLPLFEAAYNELPVVAPNWSGHLDFLYAPKKDRKGKIKNKSHFIKVDYNISPIQKEAHWEGVLQPDSQWCFPRETSFRHGIREVYKNYGAHKSEAKKLAKHIKKTFTKKSIYANLANIISGGEVVEFNMEEIPKISILTSVYDGDDFIEPFLEDITRQTIFEDKCELVIVNANSPGNEEEVINKYIEKYPENIKYFKLDKDPGIYGTWNYALEKSTGELITNANLDDRKAHNSLERHAKELVLNPDVELVYADSLITHRPNETFEKNSSEGKKYNFEQFSKEAMLRGNQPHNNPMWRKTLHEKHGMFESKYKSAGDWEFFLRSAFGGSQFKKINDVLGLYYFNPTGISTNVENTSWKQEEELSIYRKYSLLA